MSTHSSVGLWTRSLPLSLAMMAAFNALPSLGMDIYLPVVPAMPAALRTTPTMIQLSLTLYMVLLGVGQLLFGPLSDRIGRRPVVLAGVLFFALASFALAATSQAWVFLAGRGVQGAAGAAILVALFATVRDVYAGTPASGTVYGTLNAALTCVPAVGPLLGALLSHAFGWRGVFEGLGAVACLVAVTGWIGWRETRTVVASVDMPPKIGTVLASRSFWVYSWAFAAAMGAFFVFLSTASPILVGRDGWPIYDFSLAFGSVALVMIGSMPWVRRGVRRWGIAGSVRRGMVLMLAGALFLLVGEVLTAPGLIALIVPMWLVALGVVLTCAVTAEGALARFGAIAGVAVAMHFCVQSLLTGILGTSIIVWLGNATAWPLTAYIVIMAVSTLVWLRRCAPSR